MDDSVLNSTIIQYETARLVAQSTTSAIVVLISLTLLVVLVILRKTQHLKSRTLVPYMFLVLKITDNARIITSAATIRYDEVTVKKVWCIMTLWVSEPASVCLYLSMLFLFFRFMIMRLYNHRNLKYDKLGNSDDQYQLLDEGGSGRRKFTNIFLRFVTSIGFLVILILIFLGPALIIGIVESVDLPLNCYLLGNMSTAENAILIIILCVYVLMFIADLIINGKIFFCCGSRSIVQRLRIYFVSEDPLRFRAEILLFSIAAFGYYAQRLFVILILYELPSELQRSVEIVDNVRLLYSNLFSFFMWEIPSLIAIPGVTIVAIIRERYKVGKKNRNHLDIVSLPEIVSDIESPRRSDISRYEKSREIIPMLFADPITKEMFKEFCVREFTVSYALFYDDMMDYKKIPDGNMFERYSKCKIIVELYLVEFPTLDVDVPWRFVENVRDSLESYEKNPQQFPLLDSLFDDLIGYVIETNLMDTYDRFYFCEAFQKYIREGGLSGKELS